MEPETRYEDALFLKVESVDEANEPVSSPHLGPSYFSASEIQRNAKANLPSGIYLCPTCEDNGSCGKWHGVESDQYGRIKIGLSCTLHEYWKEDGCQGVKLHVNWHTSP